MKYKLKDIEVQDIKYSINLNNGIINGNTNCKLVNISYCGETLEFQTPKVLVEKIIKQNNKEYLLLKILPTEACKTFCTKILSLENKHNTELHNHKEWFNRKLPISEVKSVFTEDCFIVKVPFNYSSPSIKIYDKESRLFNYYHLKTGMEVICLLNVNNIWINFDNTPSYNLTVKEILITKLI
jgi:hypothetical protein